MEYFSKFSPAFDFSYSIKINLWRHRAEYIPEQKVLLKSITFFSPSFPCPSYALTCSILTSQNELWAQAHSRNHIPSSAKTWEKTLGTPVWTPPFCGPHSRRASAPFTFFFFLLPRLWGHLSLAYFYHPATLFSQGTQRHPYYTLRKNTSHHLLFIYISLFYFCLLKLDALWLCSPNWTWKIKFWKESSMLWFILLPLRLYAINFIQIIASSTNYTCFLTSSFLHSTHIISPLHLYSMAAHVIIQ